MKTIKLHDKEFILTLEGTAIEQAIAGVAQRITEDLKNERPLFLSVLNGSFMFTGELLKHVDILDAEVSFIKIGSYSGTGSTGKVREVMGMDCDVTGRCVVIVEDMIDTGRSMQFLINKLKELGAARIVVCTLFYKPDALQVEVPIDYHTIMLENDFVVGYGLDYDGLGRLLPDLYTLKK
ncbi:MAG: phosphoribosyltransferase [Marinifilaceae bacterium]